MGIEILTGTLGGSTRERAVLVCSVTDRPLSLPMFDDADEAEGFLGYAQAMGEGDVRRLEPGELEELHTRWLRLTPRHHVPGPEAGWLLTATDDNGLPLVVEARAGGIVVDRFGHVYERDEACDEAQRLALLDSSDDEPITVDAAAYHAARRCAAAAAGAA